MAKTATIRELRNQFPKVRKLLEAEGEVLVTDQGKPKYRLILYTPARPTKPAPIDYWARLNSYQPESLTDSQSRALHDENRGDR
jgi:antitoxin (DNA-binding transcriptional repressor) of toxin-antitoxin stability system